MGCCQDIVVELAENPDLISRWPTKAVATQKPPPSDDDDDDESEEEEEMPEEFADLPPAQQQAAILKRAFSMMGFGTLLVLVFSDPMVDVLGELGERTGVPAFYVSFVLAPLASNASELVAAYNYASKKTMKTITISLVQLEGAACMNNTFCLLIFYLLVYFQRLAWEFTAETICIIGVQVVVGIMALTKTVHTVGSALFICLLYPVCLGSVWAMENILGLD